MTRTALAIRHVLFEDLGVLAPLLAERGYDVRYFDAGIDSLDGVETPDLLVVLGGPIGVQDQAAYPFLRDELTMIRRQIDEGRPVLGICLGAQLMAAVLGAEVKPTGRVEIGYGPLTLTAPGPYNVLGPLGDVPVLHWHGDQFEIPDEAVRLAETPGFPNQAFAIGSHILGLQFHLETDHREIERWLIGHSHELAAHGIDPERIRQQARQYGPALAERARAVFGRWLDELDGEPVDSNPLASNPV